ncbi:MAG: hypothetical protein GFGODING_00001 [Flavobacteriales bacterium]|nr:hypothetical protein [Flavobacteriales bacterium]
MRSSSPPSVSSSMVKGGVLAPFSTFSSVTISSTSPVGMLAFLLSRSFTVPVACTTHSRPSWRACWQRAASRSMLKPSWVMP